MTRTERQRLVRIRRKALGLCHWGEHPADPGRQSCERCRVKYGKRKAPAEMSHPPRHLEPRGLPTTPRDCLRCDRRFDSWGAANRLCPACRHAIDQQETGANLRRVPYIFREVRG